MDYRDARSYIDSKNSLGIVPGLDVVLELLAGLGHPERAVPAIHIAGTNGKGTIMAYVEQALLAGGLKVGRYLSPAVLDYREKWQINGEMASEADIAQCMEEIRDIAEEMPQSPTSFEIETALAFLLFRKKKCDIMLVECGMGGRLDATNVIPSKIVDIIASVSLDHMQFLGDTREKILMEKLGILKSGDVLVTAPMDPELMEVIQKETSENKTVRWQKTTKEELMILREDIHGTDFLYRGETWYIQMVGDVAAENAITALTALEAYNDRAESFGLPRLSTDQIRAGLAATSWQGRFTVFDTHPTMIVDGAHNRDAWKRLSITLKRFYEDRKITFVLGVLADKEVDAMIETLAPMAKRIYVFTPDSPRALAGEELRRRILQETDMDPESVVSMDHAVSAATLALREASEEDVIVACGSLTFLGALLEKRKYLEMYRVEQILNDPFYKKQIKKIYESEFDRVFCRHGFGHAVSTARIAYILTMEEHRTFRKDVVYGTALLHDIGRYTPEEKTMSHHAAGAVAAEDVLRRAGYTEAERKEICEAIGAHKDAEDGTSGLAKILYRADKLSRNCFLCDARDECYWPEERKNRTVLC